MKKIEKGLSVFLLIPIHYFGILFVFTQCKQENKYVSAPSDKQAGGPSSLIKQHEYLLTKAKSLSEGKDSTAEKLFEILTYHFGEEERYVFPVLRILPQLAGGNIPEQSEEIISLANKFKANSAKLLAEHQMIRTLLDQYKLRSASQNDTSFNTFEKELADHAKLEEEICFPAAVVTGDYLKTKVK